MRENIGLFRGKCAGQWLRGSLTINGKGTFQIWEDTDVGIFPAIVNPETVGEFTGLTDRNGSKIFEGDILQNTESGMKALVQFFPEHGAFMLWCRDETVNQVEYIGEVLMSEVEIIGNIYDNPEILGGDDHAAD